MSNDARLMTPIGAALAAGLRVRLDDLSAFEVPDLDAGAPLEPPAHSGPNPFVRGKHWNLTHQMAMERSDPARARVLKAAADKV